MEELSRDIEQLFEAGQQLGKRTQSGARLAIFLMDNLAELMMHRTASHWLEWENGISVGTGLPSTRRRKDARLQSGSMRK